MKLVLFVVAGLAAATVALRGDVPSLINYQGYVTDSNGNPIGATAAENRKIVFRIYDDANAGNRLWTEEHTVTLVGGQFSILLGAGIDATGTAAGESRPAITTVLSGGGERYIGLTVDNGDGTINGSDSEIAPRQRITSTAFALRAQTADRVADGTDLLLTGDSNHGLGWYGTGRLFNGAAVNGPVLFGYNGGALGSVQGSTQTTALTWNSTGNVAVSNNLSTASLSTTGNASVGGTLSVTGTSSFTGQIFADNGLSFGGFGADSNYVGTAGNYISFGHDGSSEDFMGYKSNTFFFKDSPGGGDSAQPNVVVGGKLGVGVDAPAKALEVNGEMSTTNKATLSSLDVTNGSELRSLTNFWGTARLNDNVLQFRNDGFHGAMYYDRFPDSNGVHVNGPVLFGYGGGGLAISGSDPDRLALQWTASGSTSEVTVKGKLTVDEAVTAKGKPATVGEEELRMLRGTILGNTGTFTKVRGSGFSVAPWVPGNWETVQVTFNTAFSDIPAVTSSCRFDGEVNGGRTINVVWNVTTTGFTMRVHPDGGGSVQFWAADIIVVGPR